ncbi:hypothetical protein P691DRAFT_768158 [Macrolepiota fuliginosa MF-IS2]|uniref:Uncharacterized protein n=1 Tax=Macrolepiota fuliginosa MF-IS2 TaxID=1400762 RepID=A0A9P5WYQ6_9AGAR|nr:hypothetical protein P691DRAFT_768158 [Macrolepiota fuliginosa MF-IS2]
MDPIFLPGVKANDLASFIHWFFHLNFDKNTMSEMSEDILMGILVMSCHWGMQDGEAFIKANIKCTVSLSHFLELGGRFKIKEWIGLASQLLISSPLALLKMDNIE